MRGRKPDTAQHQAEKGNPGKRKGRAVVPTPVQLGQVVAPKWLKRSSVATSAWNELAPLLHRLNLLTELDAQPLARYCRYVAEWIVADQAVQKEGTWFDGVGTNGEPTKKRHPAWQACQDLERMLSEMEKSFGMRAADRFKILRDQAAVHGGLGGLGLFDEAGKKAGQPGQDDESAIGALAQFDSPPPGALAN